MMEKAIAQPYETPEANAAKGEPMKLTTSETIGHAMYLAGGVLTAGVLAAQLKAMQAIMTAKGAYNHERND